MSGFRCAVLGATGGPYENNLTSYLLAGANSEDFIALDVGTLLVGIEALLERQRSAFTAKSAIEFLQQNIHAYLITHSHLDHLAGLVIGSQVDTPKSILGLAVTLEAIQTHLFNNTIWPNYGDAGPEPRIGHYHYLSLAPGRESAIPGTELFVEPFVLIHQESVLSTAFLIRYRDEYVLFFGDTASDFTTGQEHMAAIWRRVAPLVRAHKLRALFLECSYSDQDHEPGMESHLTPTLVMQELEVLATLAGSKLSTLSFVVLHRKEVSAAGRGAIDQIADELRSKNSVGIKLIFPAQGELLTL